MFVGCPLELEGFEQSANETPAVVTRLCLADVLGDGKFVIQVWDGRMNFNCNVAIWIPDPPDGSQYINRQ